ncbi:MAG: hypothetical protein ISS56_02665 [Anaerolineae bacterium]|nr:hypothetical protein [Anaerolineae bacterium]
MAVQPIEGFRRFDTHHCVSGSTASHNTRNILPVLRQLGDETLGWPDPP